MYVSPSGDAKETGRSCSCIRMLSSASGGSQGSFCTGIHAYRMLASICSGRCRNQLLLLVFKRFTISMYTMKDIVSSWSVFKTLICPAAAAVAGEVLHPLLVRATWSSDQKATLWWIVHATTLC